MRSWDRRHETLDHPDVHRGVYAGYEKGTVSIAVEKELKPIKMAELSDDDRKFVREQIQDARYLLLPFGSYLFGDSSLA